MSKPKFTVKFKNTQPVVWADKIKPFNPDLSQSFHDEMVNWVSDNLINPMFNTSNSKLLDESMSKPQEIKPNDLVDALLEDNLNPNQNADDEQQLTAVFQKAAEFVDTSKWYSYQQQLSTDLVKLGHNALPSSNIRYTYEVDIVPTSKPLINDFSDASKRKAFLSAWSGYFYQNALQRQLNTIVFPDDQAQNDFQTFVGQYAIQNPTGDSKIDNKLAQASQTPKTGNFSTTWLLGNGDFTSDQMSINKVMLNIIAEYSQQHPDKILWVPTSIRQAICPTSFNLVNLTTLSQMEHADFVKELNMIANGINYLHKFDFASINSLATADSVDKSLNKEHTDTHQDNHHGDGHDSSKRRSFSRKNMSTKRQIKMVKDLLSKCLSKAPSSNSYKTRHTTFMRGNRRHPDDINLPGKVTKIAYRPDIAIYLDTSGSISEAEYRNAVTLLIKLTQVLNTNLYFTSFSHYVTQPVKLATKQKSASAIYQQIQKIPKAGGGTEYENVWDLIDQMSNYTKYHREATQLNFIITDFEYNVSTSANVSKKRAGMSNTYYLPMHEDNASDQQYLVNSASSFADEMAKSGFKGIYNHILL